MKEKAERKKEREREEGKIRVRPFLVIVRESRLENPEFLVCPVISFSFLVQHWSPREVEFFLYKK